jgi:DNA-binding IclR family transcriptional regulator
MSNTEPYPGTQAVLRALCLLKLFTDEQPQISLAELAQRANLNKTTVYRLLTALESEGLVIRNDTGDTYRLGPAMIVLGGRAMRANSLRTISRPELELLAQHTRETVTVEILSHGQVLILDEVDGGYLVGAAPNVGSYWPLHATATGKVLLAHLPAEQRQDLLQPPLTAYTENTLTSLDNLSNELDKIKTQGYAVGNQELEIGFTSVGVPIYNHEEQVIAAMSVGGSSARLTQNTLAELATLAKESAGRISAMLGFKAGL